MRVKQGALAIHGVAADWHIPGERRLLHGRLGEPPSAPPKGIVIAPPPPAPVPAQGAQPISLPPVQLTRCRTHGWRRSRRSAGSSRGPQRAASPAGTGILIGPYHLLTCAHVIFPQEDQLTTEIIVFPGQNGPDSHCRVKSDGWAVSPGYRGTNCNTAGEDYGIIRLSCPMNPGFMPLRAFRPHDPPRCDRQPCRLSVGPIGESAAHVFQPRHDQEWCHHNKLHGDPEERRRDPPQRAHHAQDQPDHPCDTAPSQSGSPMWIVQAGGRFLVALHAGRVGANKRGKAVLLNEAVRRRVAAEWMTRTFPPLPLPT